MSNDRMTSIRTAMQKENRMHSGLRLRALYRSAGFTRSTAATFLHVSERTVHNWETGKHAVPFAVFKLLRIWARYELPGTAWNGWCIHSGKLWSPKIVNTFLGSQL